MIPRMFPIVMLAALVSVAGAPRAWPAPIETDDLVIADATGTLSAGRLERMAGEAQATLDRVVAFWSADSGIGRFGKIRVVFDLSGKDDHHSVFYWEGTGAERRRVVRVFGFDPAPQEMAHKLAAAIFPQKDKLIRNMMGVLTESRIGNRLAFPMCGFDVDTWVAAFLNARSYLPLAELGPDHESWGMAFSGRGRVSVFDRAKQHRAYVEAGSFGAYLFRRYGVPALKRLQRLSQQKARPFEDAFGIPMRELEADWLAALRAGEGQARNDIATVSRLIEADPVTACRKARMLAAGGK